MCAKFHVEQKFVFTFLFFKKVILDFQTISSGHSVILLASLMKGEVIHARSGMMAHL